MERIDGYLVIDDYKNVDFDSDRRRYLVYIDGIEYYFKETDMVYEEIIGYNALKFLGIDACYTDLAILNGKRGIISRSFRDNSSKLISGSELLGDYLAHNFDAVAAMGFVGELANWVRLYGIEDKMKYLSSFYVNNLEVICSALEDKYKNKVDIKKIMHEFIVMYMVTIIFGDIDKNPNNWFIMENVNGVRLAPLFDNGELLSYYDDECDPNDVFSIFSVCFEDVNVNQMESLKVFFKRYDYFDLFNEMFNKVMFNFNEILKMSEVQIGRDIPDDDKGRLIEAFNKHCNRIKGVVDSYSDNKKR